MTYVCKDNVMVPDGTLVYYHGVLEKEHGFCAAYRLGNGLYQLEAAQKGHPIYHGVGRERFTVVPVPDIPEPALEPGLYQSKAAMPNDTVDCYVLTPDGRWFWFDVSDRARTERLDKPAYELSDLVPWTTE